VNARSAERVKPSSQSDAAAEWRVVDRDRLVIRFEFASRQWSGTVEPYDDTAGAFGEVRDLSQAQLRRSGPSSISC